MKTTSYEISRQLAEIGFVAETSTTKALLGTKDYPAYHLETILEQLPKHYVLKNDWIECFLCGDFNGIRKKGNESLADLAGKLLISLYNKGLINFNEVK